MKRSCAHQQSCLQMNTCSLTYSVAVLGCGPSPSRKAMPQTTNMPTQYATKNSRKSTSLHFLFTANPCVLQTKGQLWLVAEPSCCMLVFVHAPRWDCCCCCRGSVSHLVVLLIVASTAAAHG